MISSDYFWINQYDNSKYYVVVPLDYHEEIVWQLAEHNLVNEKDYVYPVHKPITVTADSNYKDRYENTITIPDNITDSYRNLRITFKGFGSSVVLGEELSINGKMDITCDNDSRIEIGNACRFSDDTQWYAWKNTNIFIGNDVRFGKEGLLEAVRNASCTIKDGTRIGKNYRIIAHINTSVSIGRDCEISYDFSLRTNDGHSIFDIQSGENINASLESNKLLEINISDHVWIGTRCMILGKSSIGCGSIIGAYSLVKGKIPNNCIAAGVVATVGRKNICWSRENCAEDMSVIPEYYINYTHVE